MARCTRTEEMEVHHIRRDGGNDINNARVLCQKCHEATATYGSDGNSPPPFSAAVKLRAYMRAANQCQCESTSGCH